MEFVSPEGLRQDGRRANEIRKLVCQMGVVKDADGSAYYEQGNTKVIATVLGPRERERGPRAEGGGVTIRCEYNVASFSTADRKRRVKYDRKLIEIANKIVRTFECVVIPETMQGSALDITVQVLQADGGMMCCAINAVSMALVDAGVQMSDVVCACEAGYLDGVAVLDLNHLETTGNGPQVDVAYLPASQKLSMVEIEGRIPVDALEKVTALGCDGALLVHRFLCDVIRERTARLIVSRGS